VAQLFQPKRNALESIQYANAPSYSCFSASQGSLYYGQKFRSFPRLETLLDESRKYGTTHVLILDGGEAPVQDHGRDVILPEDEASGVAAGERGEATVKHAGELFN